MSTEQNLRDMIDSCYTYGGYTRDTWNFERYITPYREALGEDRFNQVYDEHVKNLQENFEIHHNVYTDSEGCTYNSLVKKSNSHE